MPLFRQSLQAHRVIGTAQNSLLFDPGAVNLENVYFHRNRFTYLFEPPEVIVMSMSILARLVSSITPLPRQTGLLRLQMRKLVQQRIPRRRIFLGLLHQYRGDVRLGLLQPAIPIFAVSIFLEIARRSLRIQLKRILAAIP